MFNQEINSNLKLTGLFTPLNEIMFFIRKIFFCMKTKSSLDYYYGSDEVGFAIVIVPDLNILKVVGVYVYGTRGEIKKTFRLRK